MNATLRFALAAAGTVVAGQALAQVTFYEREGVARTCRAAHDPITGTSPTTSAAAKDTCN